MGIKCCLIYFFFNYWNFFRFFFVVCVYLYWRMWVEVERGESKILKFLYFWKKFFLVFRERKESLIVICVWGIERDIKVILGFSCRIFVTIILVFRWDVVRVEFFKVEVLFYFWRIVFFFIFFGLLWIFFFFRGFRCGVRRKRLVYLIFFIWKMLNYCILEFKLYLIFWKKESKKFE